MFERFTDQARGVVVGAGELAKEQHSAFIRRHHLLIALLDTSDEGSDVVATILDKAEIDRAELRAKVLASLKATEEPVAEAEAKLPFTAETRKAIELSLREALSLGHNYIGRAHLLLGILRGADGPLAEVVATTKLTHSLAREVVIAEVPPVVSRGRRGRIMREMRSRPFLRGGLAPRSTPGLLAVLRRVQERVGDARLVTTGDFLVALLETPGTHFASALAGVTLPETASVRAQVDKQIEDGVLDGTEDAVRVDADTGSVTINDPQIAEELKKLVGEGGVTPDALREILKRLRAEG